MSSHLPLGVDLGIVNKAGLVIPQGECMLGNAKHCGVFPTVTSAILPAVSSTFSSLACKLRTAAGQLRLVLRQSDLHRCLLPSQHER